MAGKLNAVVEPFEYALENLTPSFARLSIFELSFFSEP
jgi:hypothetical protein